MVSANLSVYQTLYRFLRKLELLFRQQLTYLILDWPVFFSDNKVLFNKEKVKNWPDSVFYWAINIGKGCSWRRSKEGFLEEIIFWQKPEESVHFSWVAQSCSTLCNPMNCGTPGLPVHPTPGVHPNSRPSSQWCHPAISSSVVPFSSCPQSLLASESSNESALHMTWRKYWSFSFSISPSKEHPGLISFRMDWLNLLAVILEPPKIKSDTVSTVSPHDFKSPSSNINLKNYP